MDCIVHGVTKSQGRLSAFHFREMDIKIFGSQFLPSVFLLVWFGDFVFVFDTAVLFCNLFWTSQTPVFIPFHLIFDKRS